MNLFVELKAFRNFLETYPLKPNAQVLWFHLMMIANESGWREELSIPNSVLKARTGIASTNTLISNRNVLIQAKRITYKSRGRTKAGIYTIVPFGTIPSSKIEPGSSQEKSSSPINEPDSSPKTTSSAENELETALSSSPETSLDSSLETSPYIDIDLDKTSSGGTEGLNQFKSTQALVSAWGLKDDDPMISQMALYRQQIGEPLLNHSVHYLIGHNVTAGGVPRYLAKTVKCWLTNGITTPESAIEYEQERLKGPQTPPDEIPDVPIIKLTGEGATS